MNIKAYKEYRFARGILTATDTGKKYSFYIDEGDRFYNYMEKYIINEKVEGLTYENIDCITVNDIDRTFFYEKSFTLNAVMFVTDTNDVVYSYIITIKNIKFKANNFSKKLYNNGSWKLELYSLELPYQTKIGIEKLQD